MPDSRRNGVWIVRGHRPPCRHGLIKFTRYQARELRSSCGWPLPWELRRHGSLPSTLLNGGQETRPRQFLTTPNISSETTCPRRPGRGQSSIRRTRSFRSTPLGSSAHAACHSCSENADSRYALESTAIVRSVICVARCIAVLRRLRVESRANGDASSVMARG